MPRYNSMDNDLRCLFKRLEELAKVPETINASIAKHVEDMNNPHEVTAAQTGAYTTGQVDDLLDSFTLVEDGNKLELQYNGKTVGSIIDTAKYTKDAVLADVGYISATASSQEVTGKKGNTFTVSGLTVGNRYIAFLWNTDSNTAPMAVDVTDLVDIYTEATEDKSGLMSSSDKTKLDGIEEKAEVNQNAIGSISVDGTEIKASQKTDTVILKAGDNVTLVPDTENKSIEISAEDTTYEDATQEKSGLESAEDKIKLDGIAENAEVNQNAYGTIQVDDTSIPSDAKETTFKLISGDNVTLTPDTDNKSVTVSAKDTTYSEVSQSAAGLMSSSDKEKLDSIDSEVQKQVDTNTEKIERIELTQAIKENYAEYPKLCGQPPILWGSGAPSQSNVPYNWISYDIDSDTGYEWIGLPSAIGQVYIDITASSGGVYIGGETNPASPNGNLKWYNV